MRDTTMKNYHRCFLPKKPLRNHVNYLTRKYLYKLKPDELMDEETERIKTFEMLAGIDNMGNDAVTQFIQVFTQQQNPKILFPMARLLFMMSANGPLSSVLPF